LSIWPDPSFGHVTYVTLILVRSRPPQNSFAHRKEIVFVFTKVSMTGDSETTRTGNNLLGGNRARITTKIHSSRFDHCEQRFVDSGGRDSRRVRKTCPFRPRQLIELTCKDVHDESRSENKCFSHALAFRLDGSQLEPRAANGARSSPDLSAWPRYAACWRRVMQTGLISLRRSPAFGQVPVTVALTGLVGRPAYLGRTCEARSITPNSPHGNY
jgi:hypothetical protein